MKKYENDGNLQIAMPEYDSDNSQKGHIVKTQNGHIVGRVTRVYDNTSGDGEPFSAFSTFL